MATIVDVICQRHGDKESGENPPLTDLGRRQVKVTAERFGLEGVQFDLVLHSGTLRTLETCAVVGTVARFVQNPELDPDFGFAWVEAPEFPRFPWADARRMMDEAGIDNPTKSFVTRKLF